MFTIADLLKLPDIQGIRLLAGAGGVENEISRTNIMDNPDTFDWLISGELLLSTGYIFREFCVLVYGFYYRGRAGGCHWNISQFPPLRPVTAPLHRPPLEFDHQHQQDDDGQGGCDPHKKIDWYLCRGKIGEKGDGLCAVHNRDSGFL